MPPMAEDARLRFIESPAPPAGESPPVFELALEEALFRFFEREGGPPALRLWRPRSLCVVLGTGRPAARDVKLPLCREEDVPVLRRFSGGGTVVHSPGQLCFSFFLPFALHPSLRTVEGSYRFVFSLVERALSALGVEGLAFREPCDFALDDRKVSGNAQRRGRRFLLHHGTLLVDCDPAPLGRFLNEPDEAPAEEGEAPQPPAAETKDEPKAEAKGEPKAEAKDEPESEPAPAPEEEPAAEPEEEPEPAEKAEEKAAEEKTEGEEKAPEV